MKHTMPIYDNRQVIGQASTAKQAQRIVKGLLQVIPKGWTVTVLERDTDIIDLPAGWVYSVHPKQ